MAVRFLLLAWCKDLQVFFVARSCSKACVGLGCVVAALLVMATVFGCVNS